MKIGILSDSNNTAVKLEVIKYIESLHHKVIDINKSNDILDNCQEMVDLYNSKQIDRGLAIDD